MEYMWFVAASSVAWFGICVYIFFVAYAQKSLQKRLQQWELLHGDGTNTVPTHNEESLS